ncbi:MAG: molybdopterin cofactor-binding domain-containing protein [Gammaproteobacteria bacterium]
MILDKISDIKIARRDLLINSLKGGGALVLSYSLPGCALVATEGADPMPVARDLDPTRLDTWIVVNRQGNATAYWGKMDMGQGVDTAISQMVAEELDLDIDRVNVFFGDSYVAADQGGASGSTGCSNSGVALQTAAAEARLVLMEKASARLGVPLERLTVSNGTVHERGNTSRSISYGELVGDEIMNVPIEWNGRYGNSLALKGRATLKDPAYHKVVGTSVRRKDITGKIIPETEFAVHVRTPGMLHGRMVRPSVAGARVRSVDRSSVSNIPGVQVVVEKDLVGVVAPTEWDAIRAARALKVDWDETDSGFPTTSDELHDYIRQTPADHADIARDVGDVETAFAASDQILDIEYEWPFQSHARMAPSLGLADINNGESTIWTDSQKFYDGAICAAKFMGVYKEGERLPVRAIWAPGPGSYGRSDSGDGTADAIVLSMAVGAPVRVQWMRDEGHAWDPKGPASVIRARGAVDSNGNVAAYHFNLKGFSRQDISSRENGPGEVLAGHLLGHGRPRRWTMQEPADSYGFANKRYSSEVLKPLRELASPLRTSHFRDPYGPEVHFASESFIDEMAYAAGQDPVAFRLKYVTDPRDAAVIRAAAEIADWEPRTAPRMKKGADGVMVGTGIAYAQRNGATNAVIAEVEVNPRTGRVWVRRFFVGSDYGLIINPFTLDRTIEGNLLQATSRTLFEEVAFDRKMVKISDWASYPILGAVDAPEEVRIRKINRPELGPRGAGEPVTRVAPAAIANAIYDATGVRMRKVPLTPERVKAALAAA